MVCMKSISGPGDGWMHTDSGAPLTNSTGMSLKELDSEAGLLCDPWLLIRSCRCRGFISAGLSKCLSVDTSLRDPDVVLKLGSGASASSLARDRVLYVGQREVA